jgi:hypothetical protein
MQFGGGNVVVRHAAAGWVRLVRFGRQDAAVVHGVRHPSAGYEARYAQSMTVMTTIKVSTETRDRLKRLADAERSTMEAALAKVLDEAEEARFWQGVKDDYARLQDDPEQWSDYVSELAQWDQTVNDGLGDLD